MNAANQRRLTPGLAAFAVLLAAVWLLFLSGIGRGAHWDAPRALVPLPPVGNAANLPRPVPLQQFAQVWQKPLFSPDRKPVAHAADGGSSLGDLDLTGIILTSGLRMALLHDKNGDKQVRLREGESLPDGSITLVEVRPRSALFDSSAGRTELKLPAGAPIDAQKNAAAAVAGDRNANEPADERNAADTTMMRVKSADGGHTTTPRQRAPASATSAQRPLQNRRSPSAADRLRETIQKRRAAEAAAANEGVR